MLVAGLAVAVLVFWFGVRPLLREPVDPNLAGPDITRTTPPDNDRTPQNRGSFTDLLFQEPATPADHPLDPALQIADLALERLRSEVRDYSALLVKQERVHDELRDEEFLRIKVRHARPAESVNKAFYVRHVKPQSMAGQEAIWIDNENDGKLIGHGAGVQKFIKVRLRPDNWLAMRGNRYPITELGIETLLVRMIEMGRRDRRHEGECRVEYSRDLEFDGRPCTLISITHPRRDSSFDFHLARIYIDDTLQVPVGYESYQWPEEEGGEPLLVERYFYRELQINPGFQEIDFDPDNPDYDFP
jgi:hypothetical protein